MKLLTFPEQIHWSETREFTVRDDQDQLIRMRVIESATGTSVFIQKDGVWHKTEEESIISWVENEMYDEEMRLDFEQREQKQIKKEDEETAITAHVVVDNDSNVSDK